MWQAIARARADKQVAFRRLACVSGMRTSATELAELPIASGQRPWAGRLQTEPVRAAAVLALAGLPKAAFAARTTAEQTRRPMSGAWTLLGLYETYEPKVKALCRAYLRNATDAEDASQETFGLLAHYLDRLEPNCGAYVAQTARRVCYKELRRRRRVDSTERLRTAPSDARTDSLFDHRESVRSVWSKLTNRVCGLQLPRDRRAAGADRELCRRGHGAGPYSSAPHCVREGGSAMWCRSARGALCLSLAEEPDEFGCGP